MQDTYLEYNIKSEYTIKLPKFEFSDGAYYSIKYNIIDNNFCNIKYIGNEANYYLYLLDTYAEESKNIIMFEKNYYLNNNRVSSYNIYITLYNKTIQELCPGIDCHYFETHCEDIRDWIDKITW